jgi:hypothetical protein
VLVAERGGGVDSVRPWLDRLDDPSSACALLSDTKDDVLAPLVDLHGVVVARKLE